VKKLLSILFLMAYAGGYFSLTTPIVIVASELSGYAHPHYNVPLAFAKPVEYAFAPMVYLDRTIMRRGSWKIIDDYLTQLHRTLRKAWQ
jgi:hypothetical protein